MGDLCYSVSAGDEKKQLCAKTFAEDVTFYLDFLHFYSNAEKTICSNIQMSVIINLNVKDVHNI